jgi:anti-sigma factor RsiW
LTEIDEKRMNHNLAWSKLDAYLDGALAAEERWEIAAHLSDCVECREQLSKLAALREIVHSHLSQVEIPGNLDDCLRAALAAEARLPAPAKVAAWAQPVIVRLAAVLALMVAGIWLLTRAFAPVPGAPASLRTEVTLAHALFAQDTSKLDVVGDAPTVASWFRAKAGFNVSIPQFDGFTLAGARLIVIDGQAAAQLVYLRDSDRAYLSLMRFKNRGVDLSGLEPSGGYAVSQQGATSLITWPQGDDRVVLIGEVSGSEIRTLANELSTRPDAFPTALPFDAGTPPSGPGSGRSHYTD